jgi:hypothetical protein
LIVRPSVVWAARLDVYNGLLLATRNRIERGIALHRGAGDPLDGGRVFHLRRRHASGRGFSPFVAQWLLTISNHPNDQPIDPPALDLVGRPRSLISGAISRAHGVRIVRPR